ncbi:MAG: OmpA family protein [Brumimicrobium sp.]|nr:OmpA family protein [Brumimicrobium sp.]
MIKFIFSFCTILVISCTSYAQRNIAAASVADCEGAISIDRPGNYALEFIGTIGDQKELEALSSLKNITETNTLWCAFVAPYEGLFTMEAYSKGSPINLVVFKPEEPKDDICGGIISGAVEIERKINSFGKDSVGLSRKPDSTHLYGINLTRGEEIYIMFNIDQKERKRLNLYVEYLPDNQAAAAKNMIQLLDQRTDVTAPQLKLQIRDKSTGLPVLSQLIIEESKSKNALYKGSDFLFTIKGRSKFRMSIDAEGYFFQDYEETFDGENDYEFVVWLEPATKGKQIEIKGIQFNMGSSEFASGTEARLRRIKDFMSLNSEIRIEIQGHVHAVGENSFAGKRLSLARAKQVMKYLEDSGIDKSRMEAVGYGNEFMIYPEPKFTWQEQANRRVEIKIID